MPFSLTDPPDLGSTPTTSDIIARHIRRAIVQGETGEGEPIRQDEVAKLFNVSKIPVREALKRLEAEGLVVFQRNRGAVVTSMSEPEIAEIFEVRALLEAHAMRLSVPNLTRQSLDRASEFCEAFADEANAANWSLLNCHFHSSLYADAGRPYLLGLIRAVNDRVERYLRVQLTISDGHSIADAEHREILSACRARDAEKAAELTGRHISGAYSSLTNHLPR